VCGDEFFEGKGGEDVAVVDEEGFVRDPGLDVFEAAAGFEEGWFVEDIDGVSAPEAVGGGVAAAAGGDEVAGRGGGETAGGAGERVSTEGKTSFLTPLHLNPNINNTYLCILYHVV
jgi:hypothetical protein